MSPLAIMKPRGPQPCTWCGQTAALQDAAAAGQAQLVETQAALQTKLKKRAKVRSRQIALAAS